jgi:uncharacterized protein (TIGR00730 family)
MLMQKRSSGRIERASTTVFTGEMPRKRLIALFGSSSVRPGSEVYREAYTMGACIADAGFDLITGGSSGVMEAASRGANEHGARVVGVTLRRIDPRANRWVEQIIEANSFAERFKWLIGRPDGYVAMAGGMGTLSEVCQVWQEMALGLRSPRPLILVGADWRIIFSTFRRRLIIKPEHFDVVKIVSNVPQACALLTDYFKTAPSGTPKRSSRSLSRRSASLESGRRGRKPSAV